jgi:hypothetical protein
MLRTALSILKLPGQATLTALQTATSPSAINTLALAVAQGSIQTANRDQDVSIEGLEIDIQFDEERLLTTGGIATAVSFGMVYWLGERLQIQFRYARMIDALEVLNQAIKNGDDVLVDSQLRLIEQLSDPLINPSTLEPIEASDEVKAVYQQIMKKPATAGSMFNASALTATVDDAVKTGSRAALLIAGEGVEEGIEAMIKKARPLAGRVAGRIVGGILWVDTVWWLGTSALDVGLNYLGIPEDQQRIPFLADIPGIGGLFDLSDGLGSSAVDLVLTPILDFTFGLFGLEDVEESLIETLWGIILSAALNPTVAPFVIAILDFYIVNVSVDLDVDVAFPIDVQLDLKLDVFSLVRPEPIDILVLWLYAITGKVIFKAWLVPAWNVLKQ